MWKSPRFLKGGKPPLRAKMAMLARVKENFCSISRRGMVGGTVVVCGLAGGKCEMGCGTL